MACRVVATIAFAMLAGAAPRSQAASAQPAAIDAGPLLCFVLPDESSGERWNVHCIASLPGEGPAQPFLRTRDNTEVLRRLDATHLLLASYGTAPGLKVVDLPAGTLRALAPNTQHGFVALHGTEVLYLDQAGVLHARVWSEDGAARVLDQTPLRSVLAVEGNLAFAITRHQPVRLWRVSIPKGEGRELCRLPHTVNQNGVVNFALAPGGQRLALGLVDGNAGTGILRVHDASTGALVQEWTGLPIGLSFVSSFSPHLTVGWDGPDIAVCSETRPNAKMPEGHAFVFVRRRVSDGSFLDEEPYGQMGLSHDKPGRAAAPDPPQAFVGSEGRIRFAGSDAPMVTIGDPGSPFGLVREDCSFSPEGRFAAVRTLAAPGKWTPVLLDAERHTRRDLGQGWPYQWLWLPAAK